MSTYNLRQMLAYLKGREARKGAFSKYEARATYAYLLRNLSVETAFWAGFYSVAV